MAKKKVQILRCTSSFVAQRTFVRLASQDLLRLANFKKLVELFSLPSGLNLKGLKVLLARNNDQ